MKKARSSNIEIFRMVCMFFIIMYHYRWHGAVLFEETNQVTSITNNVLLWFGGFGNLGFIYITAWFFDRYKFSTSKILLIIIKATIYSWIALLIGCVIFNYDYNINQLLNALFPLIYGGYGYIQTYVLAFLISPFIRKMLDVLSRKQLLAGTIIFGVFLMVIPMVFLGARNYMNQLLEFVFAFFVMEYLRKYGSDLNVKKGVWRFVFWSCLVLLIVLGVVQKNNINWSASEHEGFILMNALVCSLFFLFKNTNMGSSKIINKIGSLTLGVYLIHEAPGTRDFMWEKLFHIDYTWSSASYLIIRIIVCSLIVYIMSLILEFIIKSITDLVVKKIRFTKIEKVFDKIDGVMNGESC